MKYKRLLNLINFHIENKENAFINEICLIMNDLDNEGQQEIADYINSRYSNYLHFCLKEKDNLPIIQRDMLIHEFKKINLSKQSIRYFDTIIDDFKNKKNKNYLLIGDNHSYKWEIEQFPLICSKSLHSKAITIDFDDFNMLKHKFKNQLFFDKVIEVLLEKANKERIVIILNNINLVDEQTIFSFVNQLNKKNNDNILIFGIPVQGAIFSNSILNNIFDIKKISKTIA